MPRNFAFSKVNVGKGTKGRAKHDLSHSVLTSMSFGDVLPTFSKLMIPGSSLKGNLDTKIRVMPMPLPPFGKCAFHQYGQFVPITDLYRPFPELMSGLPYSGSVKKYVPSAVPSLPIDGPVSFMSQILTDKFSVYACLGVADDGTPFDGQNLDDLNVTYDFSIGSSVQPGPTIQVLNQIFGYTVGNPVEDNLPRHNGFGVSNRCMSGKVFNPDSGTDSYDALQKGVSFDPSLGDFLLFAKGEVVKQYYPGWNSGHLLVVVRLTAEGRRLVRALNNLGISISPLDYKQVSLLPLAAYYKAWFDVFYPKRDLNWTDTGVYELFDYLSESGADPASFNNSATLPSGTRQLVALHQFFVDLSDMWATCDPNYFTSATTSSNQYPQSLELTSSEYALGPDGESGTEFQEITGEIGKGAPATARVVQGDNNFTNFVTRVQLQLVNTLQRYINTNNVIGRNLDAFFKAHFDGYTGKSVDSKFAGASVTDIQLGDVITTADTSQGKAGDFAGVGFGAGGYKVNYTTREYGYFIVFGAVIPVANYTQGTEYDAYITKSTEFPQPEFDCLGLEGIKQRELFAPNYGFRGFDEPEFANLIDDFGYQPRYTGHKVMKSIVSGEPRFMSSRDQWLGFSLDNLMSAGTVVQNTTPGANESDKSMSLLTPHGVYAGTLWRWLGRYPWLGNQSRIFYDKNTFSSATQNDPVWVQEISGHPDYSNSCGSAPSSDGFIMYVDCSIDYISPLRSISASYDTLDGSNYVDHE